MNTVLQITHRGVHVPRATELAKKVVRELTVAPSSQQSGGGFVKRFKVYVETATHFIVPLHWAQKAFPDLEFHDTRTKLPATPMNFVGALKPDLHQPEAVAAVMQSLRTTGGAMLCLAVGYGKSTCGLYIATQLQCKTLIVVHKEFLMHQWIERIQQHIPMASITKVQGQVCDTSGDFVVAMLQTLVSRKYPPSTFAACGLLIVDECHHIAAQVFSSAMFSLCVPHTLGLSATPHRSDGLGRVVNWFLGDVAFYLRRENQSTTHVKTVRYSCPRYDAPPPINRRGDVCFTSIITHMVNDGARTYLVVQEVVELARRQEHVLVLSHRRDHCKTLADGIRQAGIASVATYLGGDKAVPSAQVIVATYSLTSEGFDCPRLSALVLASPASNVEQSCGRVMRGSANTRASIVDIVDHWGVCFAQHAKRRAFYKKSGFRVSSVGDDQGAEAEREPVAQGHYAFVDGEGEGEGEGDGAE